MLTWDKRWWHNLQRSARGLKPSAVILLSVDPISCSCEYFIWNIYSILFFGCSSSAKLQF